MSDRLALLVVGWLSDNDVRLVGVLAHETDEDYERGRELIAGGAAW